MVKLNVRLALLLMLATPLAAEITVTSSTVTSNGALSQQLFSKLGDTLDQVFYGVASLAGPGIVNSAAFSATQSVSRQHEELPRFQLEPSAALILPKKDSQGDEKLTAMPLYAVNLVVGFRLDEMTALQARAFYLPSISLPVKNSIVSVQPYNFGLTLTRQLKKPGSEWYNPALITPLDFGYMHGSLDASFRSNVSKFSFDPVGDGSKGTADASLSFDDQFRLKWDVYTFTSGIIVVRQFLGFLTARVGVLSSLNLGYASLSNTAVANMNVTASSGSGANEFKVGDTAQITIQNSASFKPVLVSNQIAMGVGLNLGPATLNLDITQNLQINATAIALQLGCWF